MDEGDSSTDGVEVPLELAIDELLHRVAAAIVEIEQAKQERSTDDVRAARTHLAALHGVAQLRRQAESQPKVA